MLSINSLVPQALLSAGIKSSNISTIFNGSGLDSLKEFLAPYDVDGTFAVVNKSVKHEGERCVQLTDMDQFCMGTALGIAVRDGKYAGFYYIPGLTRDEAKSVAKELDILFQ